MQTQKSELLSTTSLQTVVIVLVPKGGEGKSHIAEVNLSICDFLKIPVAVGTNDGTNRAIAAMNPGIKVGSFSWSADYDRGKNIVLKEENCKLRIFDFGAHSNPDDTRPLEFLQGVKDAADELGVHVVVLTPSATNKGGDVRTSMISVNVLRDMGFHVHLVLNNRDGSGNYGDLSGLPSDLPVSEFPHLAPGLNCYRHDAKRSLHSIITQPVPGFEKASDRLKDYVLWCAEGRWARDVFWWDGALDGLPKRLTRKFIRFGNGMR